MTRLHVEDRIQPVRVEGMRGEEVDLPGRELVHLQFRRFAGCVICNLHLRSFAVRHAEIERHDIREVVVFHSSAAAMKPHQGDLPFCVVADPERQLYKRFGVEKSWRSIVDPRAWPAMFYGRARQKTGTNDGAERGRIGLPADFLITPDGRIAACKYGVHANDQWSVDELLSIVGAANAKLLFRSG